MTPKDFSAAAVVFPMAAILAFFSARVSSPI
jgi:hypothetical protein